MFGPNTTCTSTTPFIVDLLTHGVSLLSIPVYGLTFYIILFKCPSVFDKYRVLLLRHLVSCFFMEIHMAIFWQLTVELPYPAICANGVAYNFPRLMFFILFFSVLVTGVSIIDLYEFRMEAVTSEEERGMKTKLNYFKYFCYVIFFITISLAIGSLHWTTNDISYKKGIEEKFGNLPSYIWCDNCIFASADSIIVILFYALSVVSIILTVSYCNVTIVISIIGLRKMKKSMSAKTVALQKNFLISLFLMSAVHNAFIVVPIGIYLNTFFVTYPLELMPLSYVCVVLVTQHGFGSTIMLLTTNISIRKVAIDIVMFKKVPSARIVTSSAQKNSH